MITPSFSLTATERVLPKLALDFTTASLDPRVTFTRTTGASNPATYVNSSGYVTTATNNQPRFDYDPVTLVCKGLLIEESRSNAIIYSEQFDNLTAWSQNNVTISADSAVAPTGTSVADKIMETSATGQHNQDQNFTFSVVSYAFSFYAKYADRPFVFFQENSTGAARRSFFNVQTGTVGTVTAGLTATIQNVGNGWYRCSTVFTATAGASFVRIGLSTTNGLVTYAGTTNAGNYIWGAQLELGAFPTSYIPTITTALTRNADVATMTGANFSSWYNATEGSFEAQAMVKGYAASGAFPNIVNVSDNTSNNYVSINYTNTGVNLYAYGYSNVSGAAQTEFYGASSSPFGANAVNKSVYSYKLNNSAFTTTALAAQTDAACTIPTVDRMYIGINQNGTGSCVNGWMQKVFYWPQRLTNNEVQAFSK